MKDKEIRLFNNRILEPCATYHAGLCRVLTGRATKNDCAHHLGCRIDEATVLAVDDNDDVLFLCTRVLERMGLHVIQANSGPQAYDIALSDQQIDAAVLDITMPGKDGFQVCRALRSKRPRVPVLFATGYSDCGLSDALDEIDANGLIMKPFTLIEIRKAIGAMLCPFIGHHLFGHAQSQHTPASTREAVLA